jgi:AMIN domain
MNSNPIILFILVLCFVVSFASPCTGEDTKTALTIKNIAFNRSKGGIERIALFCNQSCVPELFSLEGRNLRLVMDMKGVFLIQTKARNISTGGELVKRVRSYLDKQTTILRIVLDMEPSKYYIVRPMHDPSGNYMLTIKENTDSPRSQEKRITILRPDLRPGE